MSTTGCIASTTERTPSGDRHLKGTATVIALVLITLAPGLGTTDENEDTLPLFPLPSVLDFTRGSGWGVALGVAVEYESAYDGSDEMELEVEPAGAVHWRTGNHLIFWEGIELGWRSRIADDWLMQLGARLEGGREADDSEEGYLDGLDDRDDELVGMLEVRRALGTDWRAWVGGTVRPGTPWGPGSTTAPSPSRWWAATSTWAGGSATRVASGLRTVSRAGTAPPGTPWATG